MTNFNEMCEAWRGRLIYMAKSRRFIDMQTKMHRHGVGAAVPILVGMFPDADNVERLARGFLADRLFHSVETEDYFPGEGQIVERDGALFANTWAGWHAEDGDVEPFTDFLNALFRRSKVDGERLLSMVAFRARNPTTHVPFAAVLSGPEGDNTLALNALESAFSPYAAYVSPNHVRNAYRSWIRDASLVVVQTGDEMFQNWAARDAFTQIVTSPTDVKSSNFAATSQRHDRNQFFAIMNTSPGADAQVPSRSCYYLVSTEAVPEAVADKLRKFISEGGGRKIMAWLLKRDLTGFKMPNEAPETGASSIIRQEQLLPFERLAEDMLESPVNRVAVWVSESLAWANAMLEKQERGQIVGKQDVWRAEQVIATLPEITIRPWYTAEEISLMFPHVQTARVEKHLRPACVSKELRSGGLPYLSPTDSPKGFVRNGVHKHYFIVSEHERWLDPLTQEQFDAEWAKFPNYREYAEQINSRGT